MFKKYLRIRFNAFKEKYKDLYSKEAWDYIEEHFFSDLHEFEVPDILMQVYSELGVYPSPAIYYRQHLKELKSHFNLDRNILDVGSGMIPAFANLIAEEQIRLGKGTITVYDPVLVQTVPKFDNMMLHRELFDENTDISSYDLITGLMTCEVTPLLIERAINNDKDFYIAMCGCVHAPLRSMSGLVGTSPDIYQEMVIDKAKTLIKDKNRELFVTRIHNNPHNYPVLYSKKN